MMRLLTLLLMCTMSLVAVSTYAQQTIDSITRKFDYYRSHSLQEKVYAHLDRISYFTGEHLWFKIYCADGTFHKPLDVSKVAYVEILDKKNEVVLQTKVELTNGMGGGSLYIPAVLGSENYVFRAYTHWMKNFSPEFYFHQQITIVNPFIKTEQSPPSVKTQPLYDAQFFPEGGYMVAGQKNKIGFRVTNPMGKGIPFKGVILNSRNDTVVAFQPLRSGIGHFHFTPVTDEKYVAIIEDNSANKSHFTFPEVKRAGHMMSVTDYNDHIKIDVIGVGVDSSPVSLFAHSSNVITKTESKALIGGRAEFVIDKNELREGITHLTVFNSESRPVCERLFFKRPQGKLEVAIQSERRNYAARNLVALKLHANADANISISVYRKDSISSNERQDIFEYMWLTSDLKGTVEEPDYYFRYTDSVSTVALDNLMLTHGWRRFSWDDVLDLTPAPKYKPEYRGHIIQGIITNSEGVPVSGAQTFLSSPGKTVQLYSSSSSILGEVRYELEDFFGKRIIFAQAADSSYSVRLENPFSSRYSEMAIPPLQLSPSLSKAIVNRSIAIQVQNIYNSEQIDDFYDPLADSIPFFGKADEVYLLDEYSRFPSLEEVLREYVPGVLVRKRKGVFHFSVADNVNGIAMNGDPLVLLDGVPVFDVNKLLQLSALKVKKLEVVRHRYHYGPFTFPGMLMLSTYKNDMGGFEINDYSMLYEGYQLKREFYSPRYDLSQGGNNRTPDQRTLLYWSESHSVGRQDTDVQFYTSDCIGDYEVVVEGFSENGLIGSSVYYFSVITDER